MTKKIIAISLLLGAALLPAADGGCSEPGLSCLFVDASGCSIECHPDNFCYTKGAACAFGFGLDAACRCLEYTPTGLGRRAPADALQGA